LSNILSNKWQCLVKWNDFFFWILYFLTPQELGKEMYNKKLIIGRQFDEDDSSYYFLIERVVSNSFKTFEENSFVLLFVLIPPAIYHESSISSKFSDQ
jgi:RNA recognition motif-containing protein